MCQFHLEYLCETITVILVALFLLFTDVSITVAYFSVQHIAAASCIISNPPHHFLAHQDELFSGCLCGESDVSIAFCYVTITTHLEFHAFSETSHESIT